MGYDVSVVAVLRSSPKVHVLDVLADRFETLEHAAGSTTVTITEHVAVADEADAVEFVRSLVLDALPDGSKITQVTATAD